MTSRLTRFSLSIVFLLIGAGLALSLGLLDATVIVLMHQSTELSLWAVVVLGTIIVAAPLFVVGLLPVVRAVEGAAAQALLNVDLPDGIPEPSRDSPERWRAFGWFLLHLLAGAALTAAVMWAIALGGWWSVLLAAITVVLMLAFSRLFVALAPAAFGPSAAARLERLERDIDRAVERDRIAREIHDSLGHALSVMTVQAAAARTVIGHDPDFAVTALTAIEDASRAAAADLDHALGLLREDADSPDRAPTPDLTALSPLISATRAAGLDITWEVTGGLASVPLLVSREAYRIVQEALTNALRHSSDRTAVLDVERDTDELRLSVRNPIEGVARSREGRGIVGMTERVSTLDGRLDAGPASSSEWRLTVTLPLASGSAG